MLLLSINCPDPPAAAHPTRPNSQGPGSANRAACTTCLVKFARPARGSPAGSLQPYRKHAYGGEGLDEAKAIFKSTGLSRSSVCLQVFLNEVTKGIPGRIAAKLESLEPCNRYAGACASCMVIRHSLIRTAVPLSHLQCQGPHRILDDYKCREAGAHLT